VLRAFPSPAKRGKVPTAGARSACEQRSWPEGRAPGWRESGGWGQTRLETHKLLTTAHKRSRRMVHEELGPGAPGAAPRIRSSHAGSMKLAWIAAQRSDRTDQGLPDRAGQILNGYSSASTGSSAGLPRPCAKAKPERNACESRVANEASVAADPPAYSARSSSPSSAD